MRRVGILALQDAVAEYTEKLESLGCISFPVKTLADLAGADALIIPGGEVAELIRLLQDGGLSEVIRDFANTHPVLGVCAGLVVCASAITGPWDEISPIGLLDCTVSRNWPGRKKDNFAATLNIKNIGSDVQAVFIQPAYIERIGSGVTALAALEEKIVLAECGNVLLCACHPELTDDSRILKYFCDKTGKGCS